MNVSVPLSSPRLEPRSARALLRLLVTAREAARVSTPAPQTPERKRPAGDRNERYPSFSPPPEQGASGAWDSQVLRDDES